jgi:CO dehydrogenase/acetyl-CoA synthase gamma subunit (corrinoid Fe-S protein)
LPKADLYIDKIDFQRYLNQQECAKCAFPSCDDFISAMKREETTPDACSFIRVNKAYAFEAVRKIEKLWPEVPLVTHPRPAVTGLFELNQPDNRSLVLISGNNEFTEEVLLTVLGTTVCPFYVLFVDTDGNTVDMAMIYKTLTAERIRNALKTNDMEEKVTTREILLPGLASSIKRETETLTGWKVSLGPVCAAELPLFLADIWIPP